MQLKTIGKVECDENGFGLKLDGSYTKALKGLEGFSHVLVLWWFSGCDDERSRSTLIQSKPYAKGPEEIGTFATRSPERPNPIAVSVSGVMFIDTGNGIVGLDYIDAEPGTPILDIKPYTPSADRVENPTVPAWCSHWPGSYETSGDFDWSEEFNF